MKNNQHCSLFCLAIIIGILLVVTPYVSFALVTTTQVHRPDSAQRRRQPCPSPMPWLGQGGHARRTKTTSTTLPLVPFKAARYSSLMGSCRRRPVQQKAVLWSQSNNADNNNNNNNKFNLDANEALRNMAPPPGFSSDEMPIPLVPQAYIGAGLLTAVAWTVVVSTVLRQPHPDPRFANLSTWHNMLTVAQALAFPLPLLTGVVMTLQSAAQKGWKRLEEAPLRRLNLGLLSLSVYLAVVARNFGTFSFGYADLLPQAMAKKVGLAHMLTAGITWGIWKASVQAEGFLETPYRLIVGIVESMWKLAPSSRTPSADSPQESLYATATVLFGGLTLFPLMVGYPAATVPSILGKRLCRAAVGFYGLATTAAFCLKEERQKSNSSSSSFSLEPLRLGLGVASAAHLSLVVLKLLGIDGGGWWLPGTGLQVNYPAMVATPFWTAVSLLAHTLTLFATLGKKPSVPADNWTNGSDSSVVDVEIISP